MKHVFFLLFLIGTAISPALSQQIVLGGLVNDKQSGEPLPGATITLTGQKGLHIVSGLNGSFAIKSLPSGEYKVRVFFVGYDLYETTLTISGQTNKLHIELERKKNELTEVNISGRHEKGSDRYSQLTDRKADLVQNSVSARTIELSPDLSVANVAQRISGVSTERSNNGEGQYVIVRGMDKRYLYTLVNGIKIPSPDNKNRYVPLDIFPADLLDRLEVSKSLTPDKEGDAIGGAVNMIMKDAPDKLSLNANVAMGYADKFFSQDFTQFSASHSDGRSPRVVNGPSYLAGMNDFPLSGFTHSTRSNPFATQAGVSVGNRFLHKKLGVLVAGSYQNNYKNVNSLFFGSETDKNDNSPEVTGVQVRQYSIQQQRSGVHTKMDYHVNDYNKISLYAGYMHLVRNEFRFVSDTNLQLGRTGPGTSSINNSYRNLHEVQNIANVTLSGDHAIGKNLSVAWTASWSKAIGSRPDLATLKTQTGASRDSTGTLTKGPLYVSESSREFSRSTDEDKSGYLKFTYRSHLGAVNADWSAGGMYRNKERVSTYDKYALRPDPGVQNYNGDISSNTLFVYNPQGTSDNALNYNAAEKVGAAYAMVKLATGKLELTSGARYEHTELTWLSNVDEGADGKTGSISYYDVLPSAILKYSLSQKSLLKASYYSAISRPNFYDVVPHIGGDPDDDYQEKGNPYLKRTTADNFDLRYEYFPKGLDQLLAGVFYKRINNPIEYALEDIGTFTYYTPDNFGKAGNYGLELDAIKYFRWFGIRANYTFTNSEITTSKLRLYNNGTQQTSDHPNQARPLQGQSKHIANLSFLVKDDNKTGINAQLAVGYISRRINTVSQYYNNDVWQKDFVQMDFSIEKKLGRHWFVFAKVNNILNTPYQLEIRQPFKGSTPRIAVPYQEVNENLFKRKDTYGASYLLGVKFKL